MDRLEENTKHGQPNDRAFLFSLLQKPNSVLLESSRTDGQNQRNLLFHTPVEILSANTFDEIPNLFRSIEKYLQQKKWIAGYISYECGYHFETIVPLFKNDSPFPLVWFGVFDAPVELGKEQLDSISNGQKIEVLNPCLSISDVDYHHKVRQLKEYIVNGDTYQVNFTDKFDFEFTGDERDLYFALRQKQHVPFGALINMEDSHVLSFSPELFFRRKGESIAAKPMKGTCRRGRTMDEDAQLSEWLQNDEKNRSENLMIVDLLRNDIGRICENGTVSVSNMYAIEKFDTVLQMTSAVTGTLNHEINYYDIFKSLFPCGSVTGAPKIRTMQIIREVEQHQRGVYCGAIGFISPDDEAVFNVAIRTLELKNGKGKMGVGSGIVYDSDAGQELEECRLKAAFLLKEQREFRLLETILWKDGFTFLEQHLERIKNSAAYFYFPFHHELISDALKVAERSFHANTEYRVRLLLSRGGSPVVEATEISLKQIPAMIRIAPEKTNSSDSFLFHKTTSRLLYDHYSQKAREENIADYIFLNENGEITEGSISNLFIEKNDKLFTPPLQCGLLPGIYRNEVLRTNPNAVEKIITLEDLRSSNALFLCNSVRGWRKVTLSL